VLTISAGSLCSALSWPVKPCIAANAGTAFKCASKTSSSVWSSIALFLRFNDEHEPMDGTQSDAETFVGG
jgi:hypothetical protein